MQDSPKDQESYELKKNLEDISASCAILGRLLNAECQGLDQEVPPIIIRQQTRTLLEHLSKLTHVTAVVAEEAKNPPN